MENKYYTPEKEEFHVGFEFETDLTWEINKDDISIMEGTFGLKPKSTGTWEKKIFEYYDTPSPSLPRRGNSIYYNYEKIKQHFRVKSLDQSDIESLGYEKVKLDPVYYKLVELEAYRKDDMQIVYRPSTNRYSISIDDNIRTPYRHGLFKQYPLFNGEIKNKSLLKQILKIIKVNG